VKGGQLQGAELDAAGDARVSMALTLATLASEGETLVMNPGPVDQMHQGIMVRLATVLET
jgi:UDP-N-acetylglucosamine enolpyruvyl transferase